jgi:exodeoxyribonuclease VII small subunit
MSEKRSEKSKRQGPSSGEIARTPPAARNVDAPGMPPSQGATVKSSFEQALARLEKVVQELEGGELTLEETLVRYEEGSRLAAECARRLEEAEQRIRVLSSAMETSSSVEADGGENDTEGSQDGLPF